MARKLEIKTIFSKCKYCDKDLPVVEINEKRLATKMKYEVPDMSKVVNVKGLLFHKRCIEKAPNFTAWLVCFLRKTGKL